MSTSIAASNIAAKAFRHLKLAAISSFADDSEEAEAAADEYPDALKFCLEACDWHFASTLADVPEANGLIADPDLPFTYVLPADCVRLRNVVDNSIAWRQDGDALRASSAGPLRIRYTRSIEQEGGLPSYFKECVALRLAWALSGRWGQKTNVKKDMWVDFQAQLANAKQLDTPGASPQTYDGRPHRLDWATEALR